MPIPDQFIDELIARSEISDVVSSYVQLAKKGNNLWGLCPFHNEKTPSFSVSQEKQIYHCFGCGKGGGVISFIMDVENLTFPEAVRLLAQRAGMEVPEAGRSEQDHKRKARVLAANRDAARFYHDFLKSPGGSEVRDYIASRQIQPKTATQFGLGAAPKEWSTLLESLTGKGYSKSELLDTGLVVAGKNGAIYDKFRARLMLPVIDTKGDVVGFTSRILPGVEGAKYLNSPDTVVFKKSRLIYALNIAKKTKRPNLVLVEGNIDVITLHQAGFDNVIATMGTALTEEHARMLSRYTKELVLCYDNDPAGKKSTDRVLRILEAADLNVRVLQLPNAVDTEGKPIKQDPDDFVRRFGPAAFEKCLSESQEPGSYRLGNLKSAYNMEDEDGRRAYLKEAVEAAANIPSPIERELFCNKAAATAKISLAAMAQEVERVRKSRMSKEWKKQERRELTPTTQLQPRQYGVRHENLRSARAEEGVIRLALLEPSLFNAMGDLTEGLFSSPLLGRVYGLLLHRWQDGACTQLDALAGELSSQEMSYLAGVVSQPESMAYRRQALQDYIEIIETEALKRSGGGGIDPLLAAQEKYREKKGYGG